MIISSEHDDTPRRGGPRLAAVGLGALGLAAAVACWDAALGASSAPAGEGPSQALALWAVDAAALLPAAWLACSSWARGPRRSGVVAALGDAARAAATFLVLSVPSMILRDYLLELAAAAGPARELAGPLADLCSAAARALSQRPDGGAGADPGGRVVAALASAAVAQVVAAPLCALFAVARSTMRPLRSGSIRAAMTSLPVVVLVTCSADGPSEAPPAAVTGALTPVCTPGSPVRSYQVSAITVDMTLNRFGDHDPNAFMYVLDQNIPAVRAQEAMPLPGRVSIGLRKDPIQPLVIRANAGDCVSIQFTNRLPSGNASMHVSGLPHGIQSYGGAVGANPDTTAPPGGSITYQIQVPTHQATMVERAYYFHDHGDSRQRVVHGLFGALAIEPEGSVYRDPETGAELVGSNWEAIIDTPTGPDFRELVLLFHEIGDEDFDGILDANGDELPVVDDLSGSYRPASRGINYRSEPFRNRLELHDDKSQTYGSYAFGDPATPTPRSYLGEPSKTRVVHGGTEVFHVYHLHGGATRWRRNPGAEPADFATGLQKRPVQNALSTRLDAQTMGPGTSFNMEHECGAGGCQQAAGDFLFHCHIQHHYLSGMWAFWRVFDTAQPDLAPLPDRAVAPQAVTSLGLIGRVIEGKELVPASQLTNPATQHSLERWIEAQLPPRGVPFDEEDATVWDWAKRVTRRGPLYYGEPEDTRVWANFDSPNKGIRPPILFNPTNGRYAYPLLRPHLGRRPPFPPNGHSGTPWLGASGTALRPDGLCPTDAVLPNPHRRKRQYAITAIEVPVPVTSTSVDPDGMIFVLGEDKEAVYAGTKPAQPLAIRSNAGDCVDIVLTSELTDTEDNNFHSKANLHSHFVQFDPQASDGVIAGMSFEQSIRPYATEDRVLEAPAFAGDLTIEVSHADRLRVGVFVGVGLGEGTCGPPSAAAACTEVRRILAIDGNTLTLDAPLVFDHGGGQAVGVEFVRAAWYSDVDSGAVFWHDHVTLGGWGRGLFGAHIIEPEGSTWHDPTTGQEVRSGAIVDVRAPPGASVGHGQSGSFRELVLWLHNNSPVAGGTFNLRAEPFANRSAADPAFVFSSVTHGDPVTPVARGYVGDPFVIRAVGVVEVAGGLRLPGHRVRMERFAGTGVTEDGIPLGISERFNLVLDGGLGGPARKAGDYLYYSTIGRELIGGAWGILRAHDGLRADLQPLPGHVPPSRAGFPRQRFTGGAPVKAPLVTAPSACPPGAPIRSYDVAITRANIHYDADNRDSNGVVYVPLASLFLGSGGRPDVTEPLVLRVNQGECLEIRLTNTLEEKASASVGELLFNPQGSYGPPIGYNLDSTVEPGQTRTYRFHADKDLGTSILLDLAHPALGARGAYGAVIVEPPGSTYRDPVTGGPAHGIIADVIAPSGSFREVVALFSDEDERIGENDMPYHTEVQGFTGISYSSTPLAPRSGAGLAFAFRSSLFGDPRLVARAHVGDEVTFRVAQPWGEQLHVFSVDGHYWHAEPFMAGSEDVSASNLAPGVAIDCTLANGAGAGTLEPGDYLFLDRRAPFTQAGLWGLLRALPPGDPSILPLP